MAEGEASRDLNVQLRSATPEDREHVEALFRSGRLSEHDQSEDPGEDILNFEEAFLDAEESGLWLAETPEGRVVGMVGVRAKGDHVAELCRLRVHPEFRNRGIGTALIRHALGHCRERSMLKVVLDSFVERTAAIALFEKFGFRCSDGPESGHKRRMDFYLDLYQSPEG